MKLNKEENKLLSDAIDQLQDGLNSVIEMYNESEEEKIFINFDSEVIKDIEKAKRVFGDQLVDQKINTLVKEIISFLPLDDYEVESKEDEEEDEESIEDMINGNKKGK